MDGEAFAFEFFRKVAHRGHVEMQSLFVPTGGRDFSGGFDHENCVPRGVGAGEYADVPVQLVTEHEDGARHEFYRGARGIEAIDAATSTARLK